MSSACPPSLGVAFPSRQSRPVLVLVAVDMGRDAPSEPGKAWNWACALSRRWRLEVVTGPASVERCRDEPLAAGWRWHPTMVPSPAVSGLQYYCDYARWCRDVAMVVRNTVRTVRPARVHHITLSSFRVLPRYDHCGVPYSLGPLGGGEATPWPYLRTARLPWRPWLAELSRPWLSDACAAVPRLRAVMRRADFALGTTPETQRVLRLMGARRTGVVFPDRVPADVADATAVPAADRAEDLAKGLRLIWSGRALWWKGGHIAIELLRQLAAAGVKAKLAIFSYGPALATWQRQIAASGVAVQCRVRGFVPRAELLTELGRAHVFVYPTLHDSSSSALLEAYAQGLPSLTTGVGGPAIVATDATGYNVRATDLNCWVEGAVRCLQDWQRKPSTWVAASEASRARANDFGPAHLDAVVDRWLSPQAVSP